MSGLYMNYRKVYYSFTLSREFSIQIEDSRVSAILQVAIQGEQSDTGKPSFSEASLVIRSVIYGQWALSTAELN